MKTEVKEMNLEEISELKNKYKHCKFRYDLPHTHFQIKGSDFTITAYKSGKVVFQAKDLSMHQSNTKPKDLVEMSGSDEVGTGDYFGPVTVCAVIIEKDDYAKIPVNDIIDTKEMTDEKVLEIAPILIDKLKHSLLILDNTKYNEVQKTNNLNAIKAKLHNQAFLHLKKKYGLPKHNILDQFVARDTYYRYLKDEPEIVYELEFETKAENKFIAVACGAIIARYAFLKTLDKMSEDYDFIFPKGAGKVVDEAGLKFVKKHGVVELNHVAKYHFKNTEKILQNI